MADHPAVLSTTATTGSCPTVSGECRCPYGFVDGLLWDQTETLFRRTRGFFPGSLAMIGKENESMLDLKCYPNPPPYLTPFLLFSANLDFPWTHRMVAQLWTSLIPSLGLMFSLFGEVCWIERISKILSGSYILWFLKVDYFHVSIDNKCSNITKWKSSEMEFRKVRF